VAIVVVVVGGSVVVVVVGTVEVVDGVVVSSADDEPDPQALSTITAAAPRDQTRHRLPCDIMMLRPLVS
jgi:hypothetical protein